jgi:hypothetical protein
MEPVQVTPYEAPVLRMTDDELVEELWKVVGAVEGEVSDSLYQLIGELIERKAPELEIRSLERMYRGEANGNAEIEAAREGMERRAKAREAFASAFERVEVLEPGRLARA